VTWMDWIVVFDGTLNNISGKKNDAELFFNV
jgi:hypothetical protein